MSALSPTTPAPPSTGRLWQRSVAVWKRRDLVLTLVQKDFEVRYAGSLLGVLWTQLHPLLTLGVFLLVFSVILPTNIPRYPVFLFSGIVLWQFVSSAILLSSNSMLANAQLVTHVAFPREILPLAAVASALVDLAMSHTFVLGGALLLGVQPTWSWLALPVVVGLLAIFCAGVGLVAATATVYLRDVHFFVEVGIFLLMFLSGVFFDTQSVPERLQWLVQINPLAQAITLYRHALLGGQWPDTGSLVFLAGLALVAITIGVEVFDRGQRGFADLL